MFKKFTIIVFLLELFSLQIFSQSFLKCEGQNIIDRNGKNILLRGIGLGGWMLQEGYMLKTNEFATAQYQIKAKIESVIGVDNTKEFYKKWLENYIQKEDVALIKSYGFNSIRVPLHYNLFTLPIEDEPIQGENTWLTTGFELTDSLLQWCKEYEIYVILDMHACPGGQGHDAGISDYNPSKPSLWESEDNKQKLVAVWQKIAEHYANEEWIGGYDVINETNWNFETSSGTDGGNNTKNIPLLNLYKTLIDSIRTVDTNHIIIAEGNFYSNNYKGMSSLATYDDNIIFSFHKYWNQNTSASIADIKSLRTTLNIPIWCGESGENSNIWYTKAIKLLEENNIGWAWWTWKKMESTSGSNSVLITPEYKALLTYWKNGGTKPSTEEATNTLMQMAENLKLSNCIKNTEVIDAMFRQPFTTETKAVANNSIPGTIYAANYDLGRYNYSYADKDTATYWPLTAWNSGWIFRNDGVDIISCTDNESNMGYVVGFTNPKEWLAYTVNIDSTMAYKLNIRYSSTTVSKIHLLLDNKNITNTITLPASGGGAIWKTYSIDTIIATKGIHRLVLYFDEKNPNINYVSFDRSKTIEELPLTITTTETSLNGDTILVNLLFPMYDNVVLEANAFSIQVDSENFPIKEILKNSDTKFSIVLQNDIYMNQTVLLSYSGSSIKDTSNKQLATFENLQVVNKSNSKNTVAIETIDNTYFSIFPNPATEYIVINTDNVTTATIYNSEGKIVLVKNLSSGKSSIDIRNFPIGTYVIKTIGNNVEKSAVFIKK